MVMIDMPREGLPGGSIGLSASAQMASLALGATIHNGPEGSQTLSPAEQILASTTQPSLYMQPPNPISASPLLHFAEGFNKDEAVVERLSRSLNCLGLTTTIQEEYMDRIDEEPMRPEESAKGSCSRSSIDLPSLSPVEEDVFSCGGDLELEKEGTRLLHGSAQLEPPGSSGDRSSQFKIGIHPSRTLLVSNISSTISDEHLKALFETFGDVQILRTEYKSHSLVLVSFFDLRAAFNAKRELQGTMLADQTLQVQFSAAGITFGSFGEGTILVFNVDPHLDCQELSRIFSTYGDIKRIQEVPDRKNHKLIEFYDIRCANLAMQAINRALVAGSQNRQENLSEGPSAAQQAANLQAVGSGGSGDLSDQPTAHSWDGSVSAATRMKSLLAMGGLSCADELFGTGIAQGSPSAMCGTHNPLQGQVSQMVKSNSALGLQDLPSAVTLPTSKVPPVPQLASGALPLTAQLVKGLRISDSASSLGNRMYGRGPALMQASTASAVAIGGVPGVADCALLEAQLKDLGVQRSADVLQSTAAGLPPGLLGNANAAAQLLATHLGGRTGLSNSTSVGSGLDIYSQQSALNSALAGLQQGGLLRSSSRGQQSIGRSGAGAAMSPTAAGAAAWGRTNASFPNSPVLASQAASNKNLHETISKLQQAGVAAAAVPGLLNSASVGTNPYLQAAITANAAQLLQQAMGGGILPGLVNAAGSSAVDLTGISKSASSPALSLAQEESREQHRDHKSGGRLSRRNVDPVLEAERRAQQQRLYALDMDRVRSGDDKRTTLMIKNIPNKYTQKMLLAAVDETLKGTYDFFYLPIDFKNKCNVGYGFINMMTPKDIIPVYERFHNKKWERFNSEKVCCITYARIQGKAALVNHFQNSSLMHEDKKHRPVLFTSGGPTVGEPEPFPVGPNVRPRISFRERDFRSREKGGFWG